MRYKKIKNFKIPKYLFLNMDEDRNKIYDCFLFGKREARKRSGHVMVSDERCSSCKPKVTCPLLTFKSHPHVKKGRFGLL